MLPLILGVGYINENLKTYSDCCLSQVWIFSWNLKNIYCCFWPNQSFLLHTLFYCGQKVKYRRQSSDHPSSTGPTSCEHYRPLILLVFPIISSNISFGWWNVLFGSLHQLPPLHPFISSYTCNDDSMGVWCHLLLPSINQWICFSGMQLDSCASTGCHRRVPLPRARPHLTRHFVVSVRIFRIEWKENRGNLSKAGENKRNSWLEGTAGWGTKCGSGGKPVTINLMAR